MLDHGDHVADELVGRVVLDALGLTAQVVAALVDRHDVEVLRKLGHLGTPGIPEVGEAVDHDDQGVFLAAQAYVVDLDAARIDIPFFGTGQQTRGRLAPCLRLVLGHPRELRAVAPARAANSTSTSALKQLA